MIFVAYRVLAGLMVYLSPFYTENERPIIEGTTVYKIRHDYNQQSKLHRYFTNLIIDAI